MAHVEQLNDAAHLRTALTELKSHPGEDDDALMSGLMCAGDLDAASQQYLAQLDDPERRSGALATAQTWLQPAHQTEVQVKIHALWRTLLARPEVRAAIAKYGFVNSYPLVR